MGDKEGLADRVGALRLNVDALDRVVVPSKNFEILNLEGKRNSLQIYAEITTNDGYIGPSEAARGLALFGNELRADAGASRGKHPSIDLLEEIVSSGAGLRADVLRRLDSRLPPFSAEEIYKMELKFGTPFIVYDEAGIRQTARDLRKAFSWVHPGEFENHFALKACPNPHLLEILKQEGMGADCSSLPELLLADAAVVKDEDIMFTSNGTPPEEFAKAKELGAIVNFDDITHIPFFMRNVGSLPEIACCRYSPEEVRGGGNQIIGAPREAKYGLTREQITEGFRMLRDNGVKRFGLHAMVVSNERNPDNLIATGEMLFGLAHDISRELGIEFDFINLGGGIGTPYKPEQRPVDLKIVGDGIKECYERIILGNGHKPLQVVMENGRMVTGPHGFLVTGVRHVEEKHKKYVKVDASAANLMRPAMYGAYHHITVVGKESEPLSEVLDVAGSLCENNDKFAINRPLPLIVPRDLLVIHNAGAHGYAMGYQYNGKLRCAELLRKEDSTVRMIRRAETPADYFATLDFEGSSFAFLAKK